MAKTAMKVKQQRKQKFSSRELAYKGQIPGVKKSSW